MDPTTLAGISLLLAKASAFGLLIYASRSATKAVRDSETARQQAEAAAAEEAAQAADEVPLREAA